MNRAYSELVRAFTSCTDKRRANDHLSRLTVQDSAGVLLLLSQIGGLNVGGFPMDVSWNHPSSGILPCR